VPDSKGNNVPDSKGNNVPDSKYNLLRRACDTISGLVLGK